MAYHELIISGFGGQGVMSIGKTMIEAGMDEGQNVSWLPSYGPEMRGGTANCSVVISESEIISPLVTEPTALIAMNLPSLLKFEKSVAPGGVILVNSSMADRKVERNDVTAIYVPCSEIANELGNQKVANMVMLGACIEACHMVKFETIEKMLARIFTGKKAGLVALNIEALQRGAACTKA